MPFSDRLHNFTVRGCLIAALLLPASLLAQEKDAEKQPSTAPTEQTQQRAAPPLSVTITGPVSLEREKTVEPDWNKLKCGEAKSHDEADLCEQRRMAKAAEDTIYWTRTGVVIGFIGTIFLVLNLFYMRRSTNAAVQANNLNREAYIAEQRAWLTTVMSIDGDFGFQNGVAGTSISLKISNVGKTPALEAHTNIKMMLDSEAVPGAIKALCKESKVVTQWGRPVLPGEFYDRGWGPQLESSDIEKSLRGMRQTIAPIIIGCVTYQILPDKSLHQTAFAYWVSRRDYGSILIGNDVAKYDLELIVHTGGFAD